MENNLKPLKKNRALIIIIASSLLVIFLITVSLLMAKNIVSQKTAATNNSNSTANQNFTDEIANPPMSPKAIAKEQALQAQLLATQEEQAITVKTLNDGEPVAANSADGQDNHRDQDIMSLKVGNKGFSPSSFTVSPETKLSIELSSIDNQAHNLTFDDPTLDRNNISVGAGETKSSSLRTPSAPGIYTFSCTVSDHAKNGERGQMIVK